MSGENIHTFNFPKSGIIVMGNESNGISKELEKIITQKIISIVLIAIGMAMLVY